MWILRTRIWYRKYWMNCFSRGLEVSSLWRSVPRSSVTKYLEHLLSMSGYMLTEEVLTYLPVARWRRRLSWWSKICAAQIIGEKRENTTQRTFSCWICFNTFNSRYVLLARTGVLKGFMIFFTATEVPVSWSFAELFFYTRIQDQSTDLHLNIQEYVPNKPERA